jgi:hypothetical protein
VAGLTDDQRAIILNGVIDELANDADRFLALYPLAHESLCFKYDYAYQTEETDYTFDLVVDARHFEMGVVRVVYVECTLKPVR